MPERGLLKWPDEKPMRTIPYINWVQDSVVESVRKVAAQTGGSPEKRQRKGGDPTWHVFKSLSAIGKILKEKMIKLQSKNKPVSHGVNLLIRAADWVREKGQVRPISEDPALEESIGILFNIIRRRKKVTLEKLANRSGFPIEELIAFEAGLLPRLRMCEMLTGIAAKAGIDFDDLAQQFRSSTNPRSSK